MAPSLQGQCQNQPGGPSPARGKGYEQLWQNQ